MRCATRLAAAWAPAIAGAVIAGLLLPAIAAAHPPPKEEDTMSASEIVKKKRKKPYAAVAGSRIEDKQAYKREGFLDIAWLEVKSEDPLVVEIGLYEPIAPDPGGLVVFMLPEGAMRFKFAAYQPEGGEWGLFRVGVNGEFTDRIGGASFVQDGAVMTVTVPREGIPLDDFLVHCRVLSGPDNDNLWKDDAPNERFGLGVPARSEADVTG